MKQNNTAIARIVIWSGVALTFTALLVAGLVFKDKIQFPIVYNNGGYHYDNSESYEIGNASLSAAQVKEIEINWVSGALHVEPYDGDVILLEEKSNKPLSEAQQMRYRIKNDKLTIQFCAPWSGAMPQGFRVNKSLTVQIPRALAAELAQLEISSVSADVAVDEIFAREVQVDQISGTTNLNGVRGESMELGGVSGTVNAENVEATDLEVTQVSGHTRISGAFGKVTYDGVSGSAEIRSSICPERAQFDTVNGGITFGIPENDGFTADYDKVSGAVSCDFPAQMEKGRITYQNGDARFSFDTVSGNINIVKQ